MIQRLQAGILQNRGYGDILYWQPLYMRVYSDLLNNGRTPKFTPVLDDHAKAFVNHQDPEALDKAISDVQVLQ